MNGGGCSIWPWFVDRSLRAVCVAAAVLVFLRADVFVENARLARAAFAQAGGNYDQLRAADPATRAGMIARMLIPPGAPYDYSEPDTWARVALRYTMYPNLNRDPGGWAYYIDLAGTLTPPEGAARAEVPGLCNIYARPGHAFLPTAPPPPEYPLARQTAAACALALAWTALGVLLLAALGMSAAAPGGPAWLAFAFVSGLTLHGAAVWAAMLAGLPFNAGLCASLWAVLCGGMAWAARGRLSPALRGLLPRRPAADRLPHLAATAACAVIAVGFTAAFLTPVVLTPVMSWDAQSHWLLKAKGLLEHGSLAFAAGTPHNDYPLLWPIAVAMQYALAGGAHDELAQWLQALLVVALLAMLHGGLRALEVPAWARWALLPLFVLLFGDASLTWAYAEGLFLVQLAGLVIAVAAIVRDAGPGPWHAIAACFAVGLALTKLEGGAACAIVGAAAAAAHGGFPRERRAWALAALCAAPALLAAAWAMHQRAAGYAVAGHLGEGVTIEKLRFLVWRMLEDVEGHGLGWRVAAGAALFAAARTGEAWRAQDRFLALAAVGLLLFAAAALMGWPEDELAYATLSATPRLAAHAAPPVFLLLAGLALAPRPAHLAETLQR